MHQNHQALDKLLFTTNCKELMIKNHEGSGHKNPELDEKKQIGFTRNNGMEK